MTQVEFRLSHRGFHSPGRARPAWAAAGFRQAPFAASAERFGIGLRPRQDVGDSLK
jgi:hypothetical protein